MTKICEQCGSPLQPGVKFCATCGRAAPVDSPAQASYTPPVQQPPVQAGYTPPQAPAQASYTPPVQQPPAQASYTPPVQQPPAQASYTPPVQQPSAQASYTPPVQQPTAQASYTPPVQQSPAQASYTPPAQAPGSYTPPAQPQGGYAPPAYGAAATPKQKKPLDKRIFIFGGGVAALILIIVLLASLLGGKGGKDKVSDDPHVGVWNAVSVEMWGMSMDVTDAFEEGFSIELKEKGKCALNVDGEKANAKWSVEDDLITIKGGGMELSGYFSQGLLIIENLQDSGMNLTFVKEGGAAGSQDGSGQGQAAGVQALWNGTWYGYFSITEGFGDWSGNTDELYDAYMVIEVDENGDGTMAIFLGDDEGQTVDAYIYADEYHFEVTEGEFWDIALDPAIWWLGSGMLGEGGALVISDVYIDPELTVNDGFEYTFSFRPFGQRWDEEIGKNWTIPPGYDDYLSALDRGVTDPYAWEGGTSDSGGSGGSGSSAADSGSESDSGAGAGSGAPVEVSAEVEGVNISAKVSEGSWYCKPYGDSYRLNNVPSEDKVFSNTPKIIIRIVKDINKFDFYKDDFENLQTIANRTVGGIDMPGRTYKNVGMEWTEYIGMIDADHAVSVKITKLDISAGSEAGAVLDSIKFK